MCVCVCEMSWIDVADWEITECLVRLCSAVVVAIIDPALLMHGHA